MPLLTQTASQREGYSGIHLLHLNNTCSYNVPTQSELQNLLSQFLEVLGFSWKQQFSLNFGSQSFLPLNRICRPFYKFKLMKMILVLARNLNSIAAHTVQYVAAQSQCEAREYSFRIQYLVLRSNHFLYQNYLQSMELGIPPFGNNAFAIAEASTLSNNLKTFEPCYIFLLTRTHPTLSPYTFS